MENKLPRDLGEHLAISIGTAVPMEEQVFTEDSKIKYLWLNLRTLYRNFWGTIEDPPSVQHHLMFEEFYAEVVDLQHMLAQKQVETTFFITKPPEDIVGYFPDAKVKAPKTDLQRIYADSERLVLNSAEAMIPPESLKYFNVKIVGPQDKEVYVVTHQALDLVSQYEFGRLFLLESHTGKVKTPSEWITKLSTSDKYRHLPFNLFTLQCLGDRSNEFYSLGRSVSTELVDISEKGRWTPNTSLTKVRSDVKKYAKEHRELFTRLLSVKLK